MPTSLTAPSNVLAVREVTVRFGGVLALSDVDFDVEAGSITSLIGPNGAGKTTLLNVVTGMVRQSAGSITLADRDLTGLPPYARALAGVVRTFQNLEIFSNMTVLENVMTGAHGRVRCSMLDELLKTPRFFRAERECRDWALEKLRFVGLADKKDLMARELPYGSLRLLEIARALAAAPKLILLDEPAAGLNNRETRSLGGLIRRMRDEEGVTVALVEHDMELVMDVSDRITVLSFGRVIARGTPLEIQRNPEVVAAYLGEDE